MHFNILAQSMGIDPMPVHTTLKGIAAVFHPKKPLFICIVNLAKRKKYLLNMLKLGWGGGGGGGGGGNPSMPSLYTSKATISPVISL